MAEVTSTQIVPAESALEAYLQERIFPDLGKGRPEQDILHTIAVVIKLKELLYSEPALKLDRPVLLIAAYAHDWGYAGLFEGRVAVQLEAVRKAKVEHMRLGAYKLETLLEDSFFEFLSSGQKDRAIYLVAVHDNPTRWKDSDVRVLMEADTLAALDVGLVKPTFDYASNKKWLETTVKTVRIPAFLTDYGKAEAQRLIANRLEYYKPLSSSPTPGNHF